MLYLTKTGTDNYIIYYSTSTEG